MRAEAMMVAALAAVFSVGCGASAGAGGEESAPVRDVAATIEVKIQEGSTLFHLHVTNTGEEPTEFTFPSSQRFDFQVRTMEGESVWTWSADKAFLQAISHATLAPGETWEFAAEWESGNRTGRYQVVGMVTAEEHDVRQSAAFDLP